MIAHLLQIDHDSMQVGSNIWFRRLRGMTFGWWWCWCWCWCLCRHDPHDENKKVKNHMFRPSIITSSRAVTFHSVHRHCHASVRRIRSIHYESTKAEQHQRKRVVITGMGVVSPLGCSIDTFWNNLLASSELLYFINFISFFFPHRR